MLGHQGCEDGLWMKHSTYQHVQQNVRGYGLVLPPHALSNSNLGMMLAPWLDGASTRLLCFSYTYTYIYTCI